MSTHEQARAEAEKRYVPYRSVVTGENRWPRSYEAFIEGFLAGHEAATRTRVVTTVTELDALPVGSVVLSEQTAIQRTMEHEPAGLNWSQSGDPIGFTVHEIPLPARVLYEPEETR